MRKSLLFLLICLFSLNAYALGGKKYHHKWWKDPEVVSHLELSDKQVENIENIFNSYKQRILNLKRKLAMVENEFKQKVRDPNVKKEEAYKLIDKIEVLKSGLARVRVEMMLSIKRELTPEQQKKIYDARSKYRRMRHKTYNQ